MKTNVIITSAGKRVALVKAFQETLKRYFPESLVYTTDLYPEMAPACYVCDKAFSIGRVSPEYIDELLDICVSHDIGLVVPTIDTELLILAQNKERFMNEGIHIAVSNEEFIAICRDKRLTNNLFKKYGIGIPKEIDKYHPTFPLFAKPYDGSRSANLHIIHSQSELTNDLLTDSKLMFMELVDKTIYKEYTIDIYYDKDSQAKCIVPRERIEIRAGEINKGITSKNYLVKYLKDRLGILKGAQGCICIQVFYNEISNDVLAIEINPRFGGGYPLSYAAGANYPEMLIKEYFLNESIEYNDSWKEELLMLRYDDAIFTQLNT